MPYLWMTPGADIHLVAGGNSQTIRILALTSTGWQKIAPDPSTQYINFDASVVARAGATFSPVATGDTVGVVRFTETVGGNTIEHTGHLRIRVHGSITSLWFGNSRITIRAGEQDYVATVYVRFNDLDIADVTAHSWLTFNASPTAPFSVHDAGGQPLLPTGRVRALPTAAGLQGPLTVSVVGHTDTVQVHIADALTTPRSSLEQLRYNAPHNQRRNLLFLAEGYNNKDTFKEHARRIVDDMFSSPMHSPYHHLRDRINIWVAFEPCVENGITLGPQVNKQGEPLPLLGHTVKDGVTVWYTLEELTALVGMPPGPHAPDDVTEARERWAGLLDPGLLHEHIFGKWKTQKAHGLTRPRDSTIGLMVGGRISGPFAPFVHSSG